VGEDVARELARIELPLSTYTQWYWKIDLHNLLHFLTLRADPHAQYEIRVYAEVMAAMVKRVAPFAYEAWIDYDIGGAHFSRGELAALRDLVEPGDQRVAARAGASLDAAGSPRTAWHPARSASSSRSCSLVRFPTSSWTSGACDLPPRSRLRCLRRFPGRIGRRPVDVGGTGGAAVVVIIA
jgi:hypothetical protein